MGIDKGNSLHYKYLQEPILKFSGKMAKPFLKYLRRHPEKYENTEMIENSVKLDKIACLKFKMFDGLLKNVCFKICYEKNINDYKFLSDRSVARH